MRFRTSVGRSWLYIDEAYNFTNLHFSEIPAVAWTVFTFGLVTLALIVTSKRFKIISLTTVVASVIVPSIVEASQGGHLGLWWWGQFGSPLYTSIPILASIVVSAHASKFKRLKQFSLSMSKLVILFTVVFEFIFFYEMIRYFMVGPNGQVDILFSSNAIWKSYPYGWQDFWIVLNLFLICFIFFLCVKVLNLESKLAPSVQETYDLQIVSHPESKL